MKRSSVFYAKIGPRLSPKLFAMRDFLTECELYSGIIGHLVPRKIVCNAGFPHGVWIAVGDYRPPRFPERLFAVRDSSQSVNCGRELFPAPPKIVCNAGFLAACGLQSGIIRRARKFRRKTLFLRHGRGGKGCFTPAAAAVRTPNRVFHGRTLCNFPFRALSLQYTERH